MAKAENLTLMLGGLAALFAVLHKSAVASGNTLSLPNVRNLARQAIGIGNFNVPVDRLVRIAWIESHFDPNAARYEPHLGDTSTGLTQTLLSTARWLAKDMGYSAYGIPTAAALTSPQVSLYFGAAYLDWLSTYRGIDRGEEWIVRSYNGGPGHSQSATERYWAKFQAAEKEIG